MPLKLIKQIAETIAGETAAEIVNFLYEKKDINEFLIAKKLGLTINQTRNLLYKLSSLGILSSIRKKDKRKGWYIYFWTLDVFRSLEILETKLSQEISRLESELSSKKLKKFYKCPLCAVEVTEESALITNFTCAECGEIYVLSDNVSYIDNLSKKIFKLKKELELISEQKSKEQGEKDKKLQKAIKKVEKLKKDARDEKKEVRKKEKDKLLKSLKKTKKGNKIKKSKK
jgi:transcription factor E